MLDKTNSVVQEADETHDTSGNAGAATLGAKPKSSSPHQKLPRGRKAARRARTSTKPSKASHGDNSSGGQHCPEAQSHRASAIGKGLSDAETQGSSALSLNLDDSHGRHEIHRAAAVVGDDQCSTETLGTGVIAPNLSGTQQSFETHNSDGAVGDDHCLAEAHYRNAIATIIELWRCRQNWHRAEKSLTLQCSAICRRTVGARGIVKDMTAKEKAANKILLAKATAMLDRIEEGKAIDGDEHAAVACIPILAGREPLRQQRKKTEKELERLAEILPVWQWCEPIRGFGSLSLAALVGECGDVGSFKSVSALWKRLGLAVINGERQRRVAGPDALMHGYSPQRRSVAWNFGASFMRMQKEGDFYRDFYDKEKERQLAKGLKKGHAHNRAVRHMVKRFLAQFYGAWTGKGVPEIAAATIALKSNQPAQP